MKPSTALILATTGFAALGAAANALPLRPLVLLASLATFVVLLLLLRRQSDVPVWVAALFSVAVLTGALGAADTAAKINGYFQPRSFADQEMVTVNATIWRDVALVDLEARRAADPGAAVSAIPRRNYGYRDEGKVWVDTADVRAVVPNPSNHMRFLAIAREMFQGIALIAVAAAIALMLAALALRTPFHQQTFRISVALGIVLTLTIPLASIMDLQITALALDRSWVGDEPSGTPISFTPLLPGIAVLIASAVIRAGVRLRDEMELTI